MKYLIIILIFLSQNLFSQMDSTSYSIGLIIAKNLKGQGISQLDMSSFGQAVEDVFSGSDYKIPLEDANNRFKAHMESLQKAMDEKYKTEGENFLAENAKRPSVVTLSSGLQYEVVKQGEIDKKPGPYDKVKVHYHGTFIDGSVFDSSVERNEPISFPLNGVIPGWQEGLQLMTVGSKYKLFIPYDLAYGARGAGNTIKPYSALIFEVELLAIEKQ